MFSVIIPLYNKAAFVCRAIDSVLEQNLSEYELIVINDGSIDAGDVLIRERYGSRIQVINQANLGVSTARNVGIENAKFPYIAFLDADDYWHPFFLQYIKQVITENPEVGIIGAKYDPIALDHGRKLEYIKLENYFKLAPLNTLFFTSATVIKKEFFETNKGFDPQLKLGEDIDVWLRASLYFGERIYIQNKLVYYGQEDSNRATQKQYLLEETLISKIIQPHYYENVDSVAKPSRVTFESFRDKWIYFMLFLLFRRKENKAAITHLLSQIPPRFNMIRSFYLLPFGILNRLFTNPKASQLWRNYMKFCYRYLYK